MFKIIIAAALLLLFQANCYAANHAAGSNPATHVVKPEAAYPQIVLFSTTWCPHCKAAKEYLNKNGIPFINRDVEQDPKAAEMLTEKYKSQGVPVVVIGSGNDEVVMKGFSPEVFQQGLAKARGK